VGVAVEVAADGVALVAVGLWVVVVSGVAVEVAVLPLTVVWTLIGTLIIGVCI